MTDLSSLEISSRAVQCPVSVHERSVAPARLRRGDILVVLGLVVLCVLDRLLLVGDGLENPWIGMTGPWCPGHHENPLTGYAWYGHKSQLIHNENLSLLHDQAMLAGQSQNPYFYALRPGVGLVAFALAFLPALPAAKVAVTLLGVVTAVAMYLIARSSGARAPTGLLLALSTYLLGAVAFHLNDLSAHIGGPALWALATLAVLRIRPWRPETSRAELVFVNAVMVMALLFYWSNVVLYFAFIITMMPSWQRIVASTAVFVAAYSGRPLWSDLMNQAYGGQIDYLETESSRLSTSIEAWQQVYAQGGIQGFGHRVWDYSLQAIFAEPQFLLCLLFVGVVALILLAKRQLASALDLRVLALCSLSLVGSCALLAAWGPVSTARGYLSYGVPLAMLTMAASLFGGAEQRASLPRFAPFLLAGILVFQISWVKGSVLWQNFFASCQYFLAGHTSLLLFSDFIRSWRQPLLFIEQSADIRVLNLSQMADVVRTALATLDSASQSVLVGAVGDGQQLGASALLCGFLLLPTVTALVAIAARRRSQMRAVLLGVFISAGTVALWLGIWAMSPVTRAQGVLMKTLTGSCTGLGLTITHDVTLPRDILPFLETNGFEQLGFFSGWRIYNPGTIVRVALANADRTDVDGLEMNATEPFATLTQIRSLQVDRHSALRLSLVESFSVPPTRFVGWQPFSRLRRVAGAGCDGAIAPFVEVRGYRPLAKTPSLFLY